MRNQFIPSSILLLALCLGPACGDKSDDTGEPPEETDVDLHRGLIDADDDGLAAGEDCDDMDPLVGAATTWYADEDGDSYGDDDVTVVACDEPDGFTAGGHDCDDADWSVYPGADEWCDGVDEDCDGEVDEEARDAETFYYDNDGDGFGGTGVVACRQPEGTYEDGLDCDDDDPDVHPGVEDVCGDWVDNDCNGFVSDGCPYEGNAPATDADVVIEGVGWQTGTDIDGAGDVNADGYDDLIIGARSSAYLVHGPISRGTMSIDEAQATLWGIGFSEVAGVGDLNLDGYDDLLFGYTTQDSSTGTAVVLLGPVSGTVRVGPAWEGRFLYGEGEGDFAGFSVSAAGDINGDELPDIIVGAIDEESIGNSAGAAYVVLGPVIEAASLASGSVKLLGEAAGDCAGFDVADAGDTNGDGLDDVLVGAAYESSVGRYGGAAYLVLGSEGLEAGQVSSLSNADAKIVAEGSDDWYFLGHSVAGGADVDADGYDDIVVGAPAGNTPGKALVFYGPIAGTIPADAADGIMEGSAAGVDLGDSVAITGDVDGDGRSEILVGAPYEDRISWNGGAAYVVFGPMSGSYTPETAHASWEGTYLGECVGDSVAGAGDLDADGAADIAFTGSAEAIDFHTWHLYFGAAYVMYGL